MMIAPIVVTIILVAMHGYLGGHVVRRGVIFVDIALAQVAAFGVAVALFFGAEAGSTTAFLSGLGSTFFGAALLSFTRPRDKSVPQEAYIGIVYVVFSAAMILVLSQVAHGGEEISNLLVGAILWASWDTALKALVLYGVLGILLKYGHPALMRISTDPRAAEEDGLNLRAWDFFFYMVLGIVVTLSVQVAGVLMVFTLLVVPTVMSMRIFERTRVQFAYVIVVGTLATIAGSAASYALDLPTGAAIVCTFGIFLVLQVIAEAFKQA